MPANTRAGQRFSSMFSAAICSGWRAARWGARELARARAAIPPAGAGGASGAAGRADFKGSAKFGVRDSLAAKMASGPVFYEGKHHAAWEYLRRVFLGAP